MADHDGADAPEGPVAVPEVVAEIAGDDAVEAVWRNELGGVTFRLRGETGTRFVKWQPLRHRDGQREMPIDLAVEARKLAWAGRFITVPTVLGQGANTDGAWVVTRGIDGTAAYDPRWRDDPETAVKAIATGLRRLHDALPVDECPWWGSWPAEHASELPLPEQLVVCHGDPCVPNTLIDADGRFAGHVDLGQLGVADRWSDLAIATYSISWEINFGHNYDDLFFATYGIQRDEDRLRAYRELWDAG